MGAIKTVDVSRYSVGITRDLRMAPRETPPGPPIRIDGLTVGFVRITNDPPHNGEMHPDGDELLYVISGRVKVTGDSAPDEPCELGPGECCIVPRGEWHLVRTLEPTMLLHITPGPHGDHRPLRGSAREG